MKLAIIALTLGIILVGCAKSPFTVTCVGMAACYDKAYNQCGRDWHQVPAEGEVFASSELHGDTFSMLVECGK